MRWTRVNNVVLVAAMACAWTAVLADACLRPVATRDWAAERRPVPAIPDLPTDPGAVAAWPAQAELWWSAALGGRELLLACRTRLALATGTSPGRDLQLVPGGICYDPPQALAARRGALPLSADEVRAQAGTLKAAQRLCAAHGVRYGYVVCPDKETVHAEQLPAHLRAFGPSRREEFLREVAPLAGVPVLDLAVALRDEASHDLPGDPTCFALGSHWTPRGSWRAAQETLEWMRGLGGCDVAPLCSRAQLWRPALAPEFHDSWASALHATGALREAVPDAAPQGGFRWIRATGGDGLQRFENTATGGPKVLLCADSFGPYLAPWLAERAALVVVAPAASLSPELLQAERPDWCLHVVVERTLASGPPGVREGVRRHDPAAAQGWPLLGAATLRAEDAQVRGGASLEEHGAALFVACGSGAADGAVLRLPRCGGGAVLALELECTRPATMLLAWRTSADRDFIRMRSVRLQLQAGGNSLALEPPERDLQGDVLLGGAGFEALVRRAEWRAAPAPRRP